MTDLVSTAPYVLQALLGLVETAASEQYPAVQVFPFELAQYEPASYVIVQGFAPSGERPLQHFEWELLGSYSQKEFYDICGVASVYTGESQVDNTVALDTMFATYALFQSVVMTPVMENMTAPLFGNTGPVPAAVNQVYPLYARYTGQMGQMANGQAGWYGEIEWAFSFIALVTPA